METKGAIRVPVQAGWMPDGFAEQILDSLPDAVISHSPSGTITFWNRAAEALFGYRACEAVGRSVNVLIPDDITAMPATVRVNDARRVHIVWTLFPMHGVDGEVLGLTRIARVTADPDREEQRSAFLMRLDDEIRKLSDPKEITAVASRLLCEYLGADRCSYAEIDVDAGYVDIVGNYSTTLPDIQGRYALSSFGPGFRTAMQADRPYVFRDAVGELPPQVFAAYRALHIAAVMAVPLVKNQRLVAGMGVHQSTPRNWQMHEIELVRMVGSRCWESIERARVQRELQASEQMFRSMVEAAAEGIWMVDNENTTTFVNPRVTELLGYPASEMLGRSCFAFLHPEELHRGQAGLERRKSANDRTPRDYRFVRKDGEVRWLSFVGSPMHDGAGRVTGVLTMCMDSTERHVSEQRIRELNRELAARLRELETLLRVVPVGIAISYDTESQRVQRNPEAERMHGPHFRDGVAVPGEELPLQQAAKHGVATRDSEYEIVRPDGSVMEVLCSASPIFDSEGKPHGSVAALLDITDRKSIENALRRANGVLEQFAYAAAHDLQEPARNVSIYAQLLVREYQDRLDDRALQQMKLLVDSAQRMQNLIHDLLSYARATNDEDITPCGEADGNAVFAEVVENLHTAILQSEAIVTAKELPRVPGVRHGHLVQLLQNLVSNSLKYRGKGAPRVCISAAQQGAEFLFRVTDNGVGIAPEFHDRIFGVFKRLHGRNIPGTGIGLAVCERIVSHYGGRIWVESEAGRGATFLFTLPAVKKSG